MAERMAEMTPEYEGTIKFDLAEDKDFSAVRCQICGWWDTLKSFELAEHRITEHMTKTHGFNAYSEIRKVK